MMFFSGLLSLSLALSPQAEPPITTLSTVPDALSVSLPSSRSTADVSYLLNGTWSAWQPLNVENEQDPLLRESTLMMFPLLTQQVRIRATPDVAVHAIDIDEGPVRYNIAATRDPDAPRILSRTEWGADDSLLYRTKESSAPSETPQENGTSPSSTPAKRIDDCEQAQVDYPSEFKTKRRVTTEDGKTLRWAHEYSPSVKLIAVHHTAIKAEGDARSGAERVRALYQYHANNRGWGDVGYHYLIDEDGKIYEGKSGGKYVVGGHAYCNNVGTVGVALLGNFEEEKPTQDQLKALQWLITDLADTYDIDLDRDVTFHGKSRPAVVGHRDLVSTECPGYYVYGAMSQILAHAASGDVTASVTLPRALVARSASSKAPRVSTRQASSVRGGLPRRVQRILSTRASQQLRRKLGTNPGKETEEGVAARKIARLNPSPASSLSSRSSRSSRPSSISSIASTSSPSSSPPTIRIRLSRQENGAESCSAYSLEDLRTRYRGKVTCTVLDGKAALINTLPLEDYMAGLAEEPDTEPYEKQRAFAVAARTYAAYYTDPNNLRKFPDMPYDGDDSPARFQLYGGIAFEEANPRWVEAVRDTAGEVLTVKGEVIRAPYFSADDGRTRTPAEAGWKNFPFAEVFTSKEDPWCAGETLRGHGVGMSGCGAEGQANEGKTGEEILTYYYPGTTIKKL